MKYKNVYCKNYYGGFGCDCKFGYNGFIEDCKDEDECSLKKYKCSLYVYCINLIGFYICKCNLGFIGDGFSC